MTKSWFYILFLCFLAGGCISFQTQDQGPVLLNHAYSQDDQDNDRPLFDALDLGFCSVEAGVFLVDGELLVADNLKEARPDRTLQSLYLDPLRKRITQNGGHVYHRDEMFYLTVDIRSNAVLTYKALSKLLAQYADILTVVNSGRVKRGPVTVIVTGNRPREMMQREKVRYAAYDGRISDLKSKDPVNFMPWISDHIGRVSLWKGQGEMPEQNRRRLREVVTLAHRRGRKVRLWSTPDNEAVWRELKAAGVDYLNSDDLTGLSQFFLENEER